MKTIDKELRKVHIKRLEDHACEAEYCYIYGIRVTELPTRDALLGALALMADATLIGGAAQWRKG